jgi:hypothetical protein
MSVAIIIREIESHAKVLAEKVSPGMPAVINEAASIGDGVWQGDLGLEVVGRIPDGYVMVKKPSTKDKQLVPGNTQGSKHVIKDVSTVELWLPKTWPQIDGLWGPCFVAIKETVIEHPTHGPVTIATGHTILCRYQREWDQDQKKSRRNAD